MRNILFLVKALGTALLGASLTASVFAQMPGSGGMMGPGSGTGMPAPGSGMGRGMSGVQTVISAMGSMLSAPVVGPDGTAYVLRQTATTMMNQQTTKTELVAINPANGKVNWSLQIDGSMISPPVLAKDGTILLTTSEPGMVSGNTTTTPALVIVAATASSARVQARVAIDGDVLSTPVMTSDGQIIYVIGTEMPGFMAGPQTDAAAFLYAFLPGTGSLKFKVQLR